MCVLVEFLQALVNTGNFGHWESIEKIGPLAWNITPLLLLSHVLSANNCMNLINCLSQNCLLKVCYVYDSS